MKRLYIIIPVLLAATLLSFKFQSTKEKPGQSSNIYDYSYKDLHTGKSISISKYKGKKILFVNTASECGNTPQYEGLQKLYDKYKSKLVIIGFPSNDFGAQ